MNLKVYNERGETVTTPVAEKVDTGMHMVELKTNQLPSGSYIYRLRSGNLLTTQKIVIAH